MALQLLFCRVLHPGVVQNNSQHPCVVLIYFFLQVFCLKFKWCIHTIILIRLQLLRISGFFLSERSDFHLVDELSIVVHAFTMQMLTLLSVDEILLLKCVNWS